MHDLARWLAMGGYAGFVWPAYALALGALGGLLGAAWQAHGRAERALAAAEKAARK